MHKLPLILLAAILASGCAGASRQDQNVNNGWKFTRQDVSGATAIDFDDSSWQHIDLPHTWNNKDGQDGGDDYYRGPCWYRRHIFIGDASTGKSYFLRFCGAATVTDVFVNSKAAGSHRGNFGTFCFDVTPLIKCGADNVIAVRVDNSKFDDVPPLSGDFTIFGGLYREVHLLTLDRLSISPLDDASPGVYLKQSHVDDQSATVEVTTKLRNGGPTVTAEVICTVEDGEGRIVATAHSAEKLDAHSTSDAACSLTISHPHLWNGRDDPYLYRAVIEVRDGDRVTDRITQPLGLRYFRVDPQQGLFLNGKHYALHGVNRHQDRIDKGWAIGPAEHDEDFSMIKELGCTGIRLAHYQHDDYFYRLCDRGGLVVWAEDGLVNKINHTQAFTDNVRQQVRELIKQNYNHPSILFWSLYNELAMVKPENPEDAAVVKGLNDLAHQLDPTRLTTAATHKKVQQPENWIPDITGFNRYWGWYTGKMQEWPSGLDAMHAALPDKCMAISEYGAGANIAQHEAKAQKPKTGGPWHPEEYQCLVHEAAWDAIKDRPWLWGTFVWNMFDFAADQRNEGGEPGRNDKGLVTYDRKIRKDAFYFYKANWSNETVVHITASRFNPRPAGRTEIKVYSNCDTVELMLNDRSLGAHSSVNHVFVWPEAELSRGNCTAKAIGIRSGEKYTDTCTWTTQ